MPTPLQRIDLLPEPELPDVTELCDDGRRLASAVRTQRNAFLHHHDVDSEAQYKRYRVSNGDVMFHAQIGFRDAARTCDAARQIYETLDRQGYRIDRYGITFDRNMGYAPADRHRMPRGTGLILETDDDWLALTNAAPVAPHFADFVLGMPAAVENTTAALRAGGTIIGNLAHFYNYRLLYHDDDVQRAAATVKAVSLIAAQANEVLVTSNVDDGFGSLFVDVACAFGMVLVEQHIIETLLGARAVTVFGNTFANPYNRTVFQRALSMISANMGPMVYGGTTLYGPDRAANQASLAHYLSFDIAAQSMCPTGHAVTAIPTTEYERIPDIEEIIEVQVIANRLAELTPASLPLIDKDTIDTAAGSLVSAGRVFKNNLFSGLSNAGIDTGNALELLLALRRIGARELEQRFGPGEPDETRINGRRPMLVSENMFELEKTGRACLDALDPESIVQIKARQLIACVATTDVHEYGKIVLEQVLGELQLDIIDGGLSADPSTLAITAKRARADFIALSTYNGIALTYLTELRTELQRLELDIPVFVGGRINQVPDGSNTSLPSDVSNQATELGARVCDDIGEMLSQLAGDDGFSPGSAALGESTS